MSHNAPYTSHLLEERAPQPFDFESSAREHGWVALRPFEWDSSIAELRRVHRLRSGKMVRLRMRGGGTKRAPFVQIRVETNEALTAHEETEVRRAVRRMFRLDEDFREFYQLCAQVNGWRLRLWPGGGRLLRCPSLFEDIVYIVCTTNTTWSGTIRMVDRLVARLGDPFPGQDEWRAFPTAETIVTAGQDFLKEEVRLGYRSAYVWELAASLVEGRLDLSIFEDPECPTDEVRRALRRIKGIGSYAAATLLMILGRYEELAIDTEIRAFVSKKYFQGQPMSDAQIRAVYAPWGCWQYLAYWFDSG